MHPQSSAVAIAVNLQMLSELIILIYSSLAWGAPGVRLGKTWAGPCLAGDTEVPGAVGFCLLPSRMGCRT